MKLSFFVFLILLSSFVFPQNNPVGIFENSADIGKPKKSGSSKYDPATQTYTMTGAGYNIWFNRDEFQYLYKRINGDFILTADFAFTRPEGAGHKKIGWMIRENLDEQAASINACAHGDGLSVMQWRPLRGAFMRDPQDEIFFPKKKFQTVQLERSGKKVTMSIANPGEPLQVVGSHDMNDMRDSVYVGLYICSHDPEVIEEAKIWNVRIDRPVINTYSPNPLLNALATQDVFGCRLEVMNIADGKRKVIRESTGRFEAPNWMPDGKKLLFNEGGLLYAIPIEGGTPEKINTDTVIRNNNDHGISFDGKLLAISSHRAGLPGGGSTVYVLPLTGGSPKMVSPNTPSYWHGWNPNNKEVVLVGQRNNSGIYNIYKVPINGGAEVALTDNKKGEHVDGPEYSPDGKYVYYNGNTTGTMQIWRMKPDGSGKEQLTFDEYHNWFPHISPDGKWMAFISFPIDIEPSGHPSYKKVMLRLMPLTSTGSPKVIAYLYGGQGTINVPSWSPDSKRIAFVSNSERFPK
jgi:Tol biopolymer transport system component